ncbi:MAG: phage portal protein [Leptothrix sp. (in: b-proteobacteria)]
MSVPAMPSKLTTFDQASGTWYDHTRVHQPGSVVLQRWVREHGPAAARVRGQQAQLAKRAYAGATWGRTTADWVTLSTSADAELYTGLRTLRNRTRQLVRDNEYAKQALRLIVNNVVGQGIKMQGQVMQRRGGKLDEKVNDQIEALWEQWGSKGKWCHTAGRLSWADIQRMAIRGVAESGEVLIRKVRRPFGGSPVPFALEVIEADQLVENWSGRTANGNEIRMGVEVDEWQRPVAYWLYPRHPGDNMVSGVPQGNDYQRVPADEIIHLGLFERPNQTRCVPWFHAAMVKLRHMGGYEEAEIVRARASASIMGFIQSPEVDLPGEEGGGSDGLMDGERVMDLAPGVIKELAPGETFTGFDPSSANPAIEPFMRYMLRSFAAGVGISYESLSRDYSQSNYSGSRMGLLDDRDNWRILQQWLITSLHQEVFEAWVQMAVLGGGLNLPAYESLPHLYHDVRWMPRGWDWVDPAKEVAAAKAAVRAGFMTAGDVIAAKGGDYEDVYRQRRRELDLADEYNLVFDTNPAQVNDKGAEQGAAAQPDSAAAPASGGGPTADPPAGDSASQ